MNAGITHATNMPTVLIAKVLLIVTVMMDFLAMVSLIVQVRRWFLSLCFLIIN